MHNLELEMSINVIIKHLQQLCCALKLSVISLEDQVTDIANIPVACCLYSYLQKMLSFM